MFDVKVTTEVSSELMSVADAKTHLKITHTDDDTYLGELVASTRKELEEYTTRSIGSQVRVWTVDVGAYVETLIPYGPVNTLTTVAEKTDYNTYETLTQFTDFDTDGQADMTFVPFWTSRYKLTYTAGYTTLPEGLKAAWLNEIAYRYEHRGDEQISGVCEATKVLANPYKVMAWV